MTPVADQDGEQRTDGMIALVPSSGDAAKLAAAGGDPAEEIHLTLAYLGDDVDQWDGAKVAQLLDAVADLATGSGPIRGRVLGVSVFNDGVDNVREPCSVYLIADMPTLALLRNDATALTEVEQFEPYVPHVTGGYGVPVTKLAHRGPVTFDRIRVALGGNVTDFDLTADDADDLDADDLDADDDTGDDSDDEALDDDDPSAESKADPAAAQQPAQQQASKTKSKRVVASKEGEERYGLPIGTPLGQARNSDSARKAQQDPNAKARYDEFMTADNVGDMGKRAKGMSDADLQSMTAIMYSFKSGNQRVVAARNALAAELRRRGMDERDHGSMAGGRGKKTTGAKKATGKAGGKRSSGRASPSSGKKKGGGMSDVADRAWRSFAAARGGRIEDGTVSDKAWDQLLAAGWKGRPGDKSEALYPPGKGLEDSVEIEHGSYLEAILFSGPAREVKRTTTKPWETRKAQRGGKTIGKEKSSDKDGGDEYPVKTIGDIAAGVKRARKIKDPERRAEVLAHLRKGAKAIGGPAVNMVPKGDGGDDSGGSKKKGNPFAKKDARSYVLTDDDRAFLVALEIKFASPDPRAARLRKYWARGAGRAKWNTFRELRRELSKHNVPAHMINGLTANIYKMAKGEWPGRKGGKGLDTGLDLEFSGESKILVTPDLMRQVREVDRFDEDEQDWDAAFAAFEQAAEGLSTDEEYEAAMVADVDWDLDVDGEPYQAQTSGHEGLAPDVLLDDVADHGPGLLDDDYDPGPVRRTALTFG